MAARVAHRDIGPVLSKVRAFLLGVSKQCAVPLVSRIHFHTYYIMLLCLLPPPARTHECTSF